MKLKRLSASAINAVLATMAEVLEAEKDAVLAANANDMINFAGDDKAMRDRLFVDEQKINGMIQSVQEVCAKESPLEKELYQFDHPNGMKVINKTAPFGTILIIYESRPDVTIEAAAIAFKSGNRILLKGGKEARQSNLALVRCWHQALKTLGHPIEWIEYLDYNREQTQDFLKNPSQQVDLIVPRGGEKLIDFVKQTASCPVLVSGRGNNFLYIHCEADLRKIIPIVKNAKMSKISACNALDKILIDRRITDFRGFIDRLLKILVQWELEVYINADIEPVEGVHLIDSDQIWYEEFLDYKIAIGTVRNMEDAINIINTYSGGHSVSILTENEEVAQDFMHEIDAAAVYHNASTRFTDGGAFGMGGELAISTDKMHHRGPLGLDQLVTNKWYIYGDGQIR